MLFHRKRIPVALAGLILSMVGGGVFLVMGQKAGPANCFMVSMPPVQYDYEPVRPFRRLDVSHNVVDSTCRDRADFAYMTVKLQSCVITRGNDALMIVPNDVNSTYTGCLIRHENGHINGWGYDHRGARFYPIAPPAPSRNSRNSTYGS